MLLPITSRFLLEALRPERPCWKPMAFAFWKAAARPRKGMASVQRLDRGVGRRARLLELEVEAVAVGGDRVDPVAHQRGRGDRDAAGGRGDAKGEAARVGRAARRPVEAVHAGALRAEVERLDHRAARREDLDLDRVGRRLDLEAALADGGG